MKIHRKLNIHLTLDKIEFRKFTQRQQGIPVLIISLTKVDRGSL
jgi:hypothetical protein